MKKLYLLVLLLFIFSVAFPQQTGNNKKLLDFGGYIQVRALSNFDDYNSFMVRRLKFWVKSGPDFPEHWSYKVQTVLSSKKEVFFMEDIKVKYTAGPFSLEIGQFVPHFSLERFQSEYCLPVMERASVIGALIPNGTLGVRDLGLQANYESKNNLVQTHLGVFNGYGIKEYRFTNRGFMIVHKSSLSLPVFTGRLGVGYSFQYRKAEELIIPKVLPDTVAYTGNDVRYNVFLVYKSKKLWLQGEYLNANFSGSRAWGYYMFSALRLNKSQFVAGYEFYKDLISETVDLPSFRLGYEYLINDYKLKLSVDNYFQLQAGEVKNYLLSLQLQVFIN